LNSTWRHLFARWRSWFVSQTARAASAGLMSALCASPAAAEVLVAAVAADWGAGPSGLAPGDHLLSWSRAEANGAMASGLFRDPWDVRAFEVEQLPRGATRVRFVREGRPHTVVIRSSAWGVSTAPWLSSAHDWQQLALGLERAAARDIEGALAVLRPLATALGARREWRAAAWLHCRIGTMLIEPVGTGRGRWPMPWVEVKGVKDADEAFAEAARIARRLEDPSLEAMVHDAAGRAWTEDHPIELTARMSFRRARKSPGSRRPGPRESTSRLPPAGHVSTRTRRSVGRSWRSSGVRVSSPAGPRRRIGPPSS